jgi:hypothetical protein
MGCVLGDYTPAVRKGILRHGKRNSVLALVLEILVVIPFKMTRHAWILSDALINCHIKVWLYICIKLTARIENQVNHKQGITFVETPCFIRAFILQNQIDRDYNKTRL